ncbi:MAG: ATP-binding protein [Cyanobacteria bacterium P01_G01_bin.54]
MKAILFIGIQASGKSTFYAQTFANTHIRINLDMLKTRHRERRLLETCLDIKQPFVVDNTNPTVADRDRYIPLAKYYKFQITGYYFPPNLADSLQRNQQRTGKQRIPEQGIRATHKRLVPPTYAEGFDQLYQVCIAPGGKFIVQKWADESR